MAKAGINVIRIGEFTWGLCEPEEGKYDFLWLRRVMDIMAHHHIKVVLGTPTAAPPIWLARDQWLFHRPRGSSARQAGSDSKAATLSITKVPAVFSNGTRAVARGHEIAIAAAT